MVIDLEMLYFTDWHRDDWSTLQPYKPGDFGNEMRYVGKIGLLVLMGALFSMGSSLFIVLGMVAGGVDDVEHALKLRTKYYCGGNGRCKSCFKNEMEARRRRHEAASSEIASQSLGGNEKSSGQDWEKVSASTPDASSSEACKDALNEGGVGRQAKKASIMAFCDCCCETGDGCEWKKRYDEIRRMIPHQQYIIGLFREMVEKGQSIKAVQEESKLQLLDRIIWESESIKRAYPDA